MIVSLLLFASQTVSNIHWNLTMHIVDTTLDRRVLSGSYKVTSLSLVNVFFIFFICDRVNNFIYLITLLQDIIYFCHCTVIKLCGSMQFLASTQHCLHTPCIYVKLASHRYSLNTHNTYSYARKKVITPACLHPVV